MTDQQYTPSLEEVRDATSLFRSRFFDQDEFDRWLATIETAAEQRGAIAAQLCLDDDSMIRHDRTDNFPCTKCFEKAGRAIRNSADQIEQENNDA